VRVIAKATLRAFWAAFPDAEQPLKAWHDEVINARWQNPSDVMAIYRSASILKNGRVVFNIAGNKFRLVVAVYYPGQLVLIKFIGTHAQYDQIDANYINQGGNK
jgi:mRNA interferase HigB